MDWGSVFGSDGWIPLLNAGLGLAVPVALAAAGAVFCERAGVLNLGLEGMMLGGALAAFLGAYYTDSAWLGLPAAAAVGLLMGALMAFLSVTLKTEQVVNGIAIVILGMGLTAFVYERIFGVSGQPPRVPRTGDVDIPGLSSIPGVGELLFSQNSLFYLSIALIVVLWWVLFRTRVGLSVTAVGEHPGAAASAGLPVDRVRWIAVLVSGVMAALGGAVLVLAELGLFGSNITAGRGWIAVALVIFGRWNPLLALAGSVLFGLTDALQLRIQAAGGGVGTGVPFELFQALPYLVTVIVMVLTATQTKRRRVQPAALGVPYQKEER